MAPRNRVASRTFRMNAMRFTDVESLQHLPPFYCHKILSLLIKVYHYYNEIECEIVSKNGFLT